MKKLFISLVLLSLVLSISACTQEIKLTEQESGRMVTMSIGEHFYVILPGNPTTGYTWQCKPADNKVLKTVDISFRPSSSMAGAGGKYIFKVRALASGTTNLNFFYLRTWERPLRPINKKTYTIIVNRPAN